MTTQRTLRSKKLRALLYYDAEGKCQICGCDLPDDWHADHIEAWVKTKQTNVHGMQALCPACNLKKGASNVEKTPT
jgi:5-methylcytosine-specific restriction endonuclease McrA